MSSSIFFFLGWICARALPLALIVSDYVHTYECDLSADGIVTTHEMGEVIYR